MARAGLLTICFCFLIQAQHTQKAHDHSAAQLNIAVDGKTATVDFDSAAQSVVGFEHAARTPADKKKLDAAFDVFRKHFGTLLILEPSLGCNFSVKKLELAKDNDEPPPAKPSGKGKPMEAEHSDVESEILVTCNKPLGGSKVHFGFSKAFPGILTVNVQALSGSGQAGAQIKNDQGEITLGK